MPDPRDPNRIERAIARSLDPRRRLSRRLFLRDAGRGAVIGGAMLSLPAILAACGIGPGASGSAGASASALASGGAPVGGEPSGNLIFANWPLYIDQDEDTGESPTLQMFTDETGIEVDYQEAIQDNQEFFGTIQPALAEGQDTGWDIIVMTDWMLGKMAGLGYLETIDVAASVPNFVANAGDKYKNPSFDPNNAHSVPWQSGITGIAYNPELTGRPITSLADLFDPAFHGKVGMFGDSTDLPNLTLLAAGVDPETSTEDDWRRAAGLLAKQRQQGIVHDYFTQGYINALSNGEVALTMAWSGDIFQEDLTGSSRLEFVVPTEGAIIWTDCMCIPKAAQHPLDAITLMDYVYRPDVAATIAAGAQYITPVPASQAILERRANEASGAEAQLLHQVASSPLVFPSAEDRAKLHTYRVFENEDELVTWNHIFAPYQA